MTEYGISDMKVADVVRISRGELAVEGKVTRENGDGVGPLVNTLYGQIIPDPDHTFTLLRRPDPVADAVQAWRLTSGSTKDVIDFHDSHLRVALDRLAQAQP